MFGQRLERQSLCGYGKGLDVDQKGWKFNRILFEYCINLVYKFRSLKQHLNPFCSLTEPYTGVLGAVQIVEATKWVQSLFERPEILNKVYTVPKYCSVFFF